MTDKEIMEALLRGETLCSGIGEYKLLDTGNVRIVGNSNCVWPGELLHEELFSNSWTIKPKPKLTWDQALAAMREGKKVRRDDWIDSVFVYADKDGILTDATGELADFRLADFEGVHWEVKK